MAGARTTQRILLVLTVVLLLAVALARMVERNAPAASEPHATPAPAAPSAPTPPAVPAQPSVVPPSAGASIPYTKLPLRLLATVVSDNRTLSLATLDDEARTTLTRHAEWLQQHAAARVTIEGHCDERGTVEYNLALGDLRAQSVREYLVGLGVTADRLSSVSYGKERPLDTSMTVAGFAKNRRAHFAVSR